MSVNLEQTLKIVATLKNYNDWIYGQFEHQLSGVVLDIGSGRGSLTDLFNSPLISQLILSDHTFEHLEYLKKTTVNSKHKRIENLDISSKELSKNWINTKVDTITCINVLEHIENDNQALVNMKSLLNDKGRIIIFVPAVKGIYGSLDRQMGHVKRYERKELIKAMNLAGFNCLECRYMNLFGIFTWFLAGKVLMQKELPLKTCQTLDKIVPLLKRIEAIFKPFVGQSLIVIAQKP